MRWTSAIRPSGNTARISGALVGTRDGASPRDNTHSNKDSDGPGEQIWWLNGPRAANDYADLYDGDGWDHTNPVRTESGGSLTYYHDDDDSEFSWERFVWTGARRDGTRAGSRHLGNNNGVGAFVGVPYLMNDPLRHEQYSRTLNSNLRLYGLSPVFRVEAPDAPYATTAAITTDPANGADYRADEVVEAAVTFSEEVTVTGTPQLPLRIGDVERDADYQSISADGLVLTFSYEVTDDDTDRNGISIDAFALKLNGGSIKRKDTDLNAALTHTRVLADDGQRVNLPPLITDIEVTSTPKATNANDTYGLGEDIEITVTFSEAVNVEGDEAEGDVDFGLSVSGARRAPLKSGSGTTELVFAYTVQADDTDTNGIWIGHPDHATVPTFDLQMGQTVVGAVSGLSADLDHDEVGGQDDHKVDGSLTGADATLSALSLSGITLDQMFTAGAAGTAVTSFTATTSLSATTVTATATQSGGSSDVVIDPADADTNTTGHQVSLDVGDTVITVTVTSTNGASTRTYTVTVTRQAATDSTAPAADSATVSTTGVTIDIVFDEDLDTSGSAPAADAFQVTVDSSTAVNPDSVAFHATDADTVVLTMSPAIAAGGTVTVAYDEPTSNALADAASNEVADFTGQAAPNRPAAPVVTLTAGDEKLTATWSAPANGGSEITGYDVEWKTAAQTWAQAATAGQSATAAADATDHEITGLTNDTEYTVRVRAANDAGDGPWSAEAPETPIPAAVYPAPGGPWLFDGGRGDHGQTKGAVLVRWLPPKSAASDADLQGWEIQWRSGSEDWSTDRQQYVRRDRNNGGLSFGHAFSGFHSYGTEYEFRVRARVTGRASLWTNAVAVTVRRSDAPADMDFANVSFEDPDEEVGEDDVSSKVIFRVHDSLERTVNDDGLVEVKVVRSLWMESYHRDETVPIIGALLRFGADGRKCDQWGREGDGFANNRDIDLEILHPGAAKADWEHVGWSGNQYEIAQRNFGCYYRFKGILPTNVVAAAQQFVTTPGEGTYLMEDPDPDVAQLSGAVSGNGALTISWQQEMWAGARVLADFSQEGYEGKTLPSTDHFPVIQWVVADQEFSDDLYAAANDFGDDSGVYALDGDELKAALLAAEYTITGLENDTAYKVRFAYGDGGEDQSVSTRLTSNVVTGTPELVEPVAGSAAVSEDGETIDIVFDQDLDTNVSAPAASAFTVTVGTASGVNPDNAAFHATDATTITLTMDSADTIAAGDTVSVTYTKPSTNVIQNSNDQETDGFTVSATNRPAAPGTPTLTSGAGTLDVTWTAPAADGGSPVTGYTVQWRTGSQTWDDAVAEGQTASAAASPYQITGLVPVAYTVRVVATNVAGSGPPSPEQTATPTAARPTITAVAVTSTPKAATDTYGLGEDIEITVEFNEAVEVEGDVEFGLSVGGAVRARLKSGNGTTELVFAYTVQAGDTDTNGIWIGDHTHSTNPTLALQGDQSVVGVDSGLDALLEHDEVGTQGDHKVDGSLTAADATLSALSLSGITLDQTFTAGAAGTAITGFTATTSASSTTVTATATQSGGSSGVDIDPDDADANTTGHQVTLAEDADTVITVTVTASNGDSMRAYTVTVTREAATDSTAPTVDSAAVSTDGTTIAIVFDEDLDASGSAPAADAFEVTVDGGTAVNPASVAFHATDANTVVLTMSPAIAAGGTVTVAYDQPTSNALADAASNEVADFTGQAAPNRPAAPVVTLTAGNGQLTAAWAAPANGGSAITGYDVEWKTAAQTWAEAATAGQSATAAADATDHEITGLTNDTEYMVRVRAGNDAGDGSWSAEASETPVGAIINVTAEFDADAYTAIEGQGAVTITVTLSADPGRSVTIPIIVAGNGGADTDDYSLSPTSVTISSGDTSATFTVTATDDDVYDGYGNDDTLTLEFGNPLPSGVSPGAQSTATVGLIDNEILVTSELVPDGTMIGVGFRLLFVTSGEIYPTSSDIDVYNQFVQDAVAGGARRHPGLPQPVPGAREHRVGQRPGQHCHQVHVVEPGCADLVAQRRQRRRPLPRLLRRLVGPRRPRQQRDWIRGGLLAHG